EMDSLFEDLRSRARQVVGHGVDNASDSSRYRTVSQADIDEMEQMQEEAARESDTPLEQQFAEHDAAIARADRKARRQAQRAAELDAALLRVLSGRLPHSLSTTPGSSHLSVEADVSAKPSSAP